MVLALTAAFALGWLVCDACWQERSVQQRHAHWKELQEIRTARAVNRVFER
jgi:hypothetical protein